MAYQNQICMNKNTSRRKRINKTTIIFPHPLVHNLFQKNFYLYNCLVCLFFFTLFISVSIESQNYKCGLASFSISGSFCIWNCTEMLSSYNKKRKVIDKNNEDIWKRRCFQCLQQWNYIVYRLISLYFWGLFYKVLPTGPVSFNLPR